MGLVDYSDSESETETVQQQQQQPAPSAAAPPKKPFQRLLDRSTGSGKIVVNLPAASPPADAIGDDDQPPAKRAKLAGGSRFSSLGSFLPPPKKTGAAAPAAGSRKPGTAPAPGVHLRTAAEPAFVRDGDGADATGDGEADGGAGSSGLSLPSPASRGPAGPSIPDGQKPEEEVKLVGKPLMFKPLSVARKKAPAKNKKNHSAGVAASAAPAAAAATAPNGATAAGPATPSIAEPPPKKKISLFSMGDEEPASTVSSASAAAAAADIYEPIFNSAAEPDETDVTSAYPSYEPQPHHQQQQRPPQQQSQQDLDPLSSLAETLSPAARRELFGRTPSSSSSAASSRSSLAGAAPPRGAKVITFDMEREYAHNEALRASGAQQAYNPVRSIAPGNHSLRQVVNMAQSNQAALEESFARARGNKREAAGRYGW